MRYIKIKSKEEIDIEAFTLIGASTKKDDDSKIGMFGSGNKYAIASLIRNKMGFKVYSGEKEVVFTTKKTKFRDIDFNVILVNGKETSLTTTMGGKDWDTAFAPIREIYSNALDEDEDFELSETTDPKGESGFSTFFIEINKDVNDFYKNKEQYFCFTNPRVIYSDNNGAIYPPNRKGRRFYRKGILCCNDTKKSVYQYNSSNYTINESRVSDSGWNLNYYTTSLLKECSDETVIATLLEKLRGGNSGYYEHDLDWEYHSFSKTWENVTKKIKFAPAESTILFEPHELQGRYILPMTLIKALLSQFKDLDVLGLTNGGKEVFNKIKPSQILINKVLDAISILKDTKYKTRLNDIEIVYVRFLSDTVLGLASEGKIYLSEKLDCKDINYIAKIIIEENEHNKTGKADCTRGFQNHLFDLYFDELINKLS